MLAGSDFWFIEHCCITTGPAQIFVCLLAQSAQQPFESLELQNIASCVNHICKASVVYRIWHSHLNKVLMQPFVLVNTDRWLE